MYANSHDDIDAAACNDDVDGIANVNEDVTTTLMPKCGVDDNADDADDAVDNHAGDNNDIDDDVVDDDGDGNTTTPTLNEAWAMLSATPKTSTDDDIDGVVKANGNVDVDVDHDDGDDAR